MNGQLSPLTWAMLAACPSIASAFVARPIIRLPARRPAPIDIDRCRVPRRHPRRPLCASDDGNDVVELAPYFTSPSTLEWLQKMADSYKLERGEELLDVLQRESSNLHADLDLAAACALTNLPIASHDFLRDPSGEAIYCYGNLAFLSGFGYEWKEFVQLPSRKCVASDEEVEERQKLLDEVKASAMAEGDEDVASNYDNLIRVRKDGKRILLRGVNLWNVYDICLNDVGEDEDAIRARIEGGEIEAVGQAVWIRHVDFLE